MSSSDSGFWCQDATAQLSADDAPSQRRGRRGVLASQSEGRVTPRYAKIGGKGTPFPVCLTHTSLPCTLEQVSQTNMNGLFKGSLRYGDTIGRLHSTPAFGVCADKDD